MKNRQIKNPLIHPDHIVAKKKAMFCNGCKTLFKPGDEQSHLMHNPDKQEVFS